MARVTVVLLSYNYADYVEDAIDSVFAQEFQDFELVIVENGSTDDSPALIARFLDDPRVRLYSLSSNDRISRRLNFGIGKATGEFISILYADDMLLPNKLAEQVEAFDEGPPDLGVVYGLARVRNDETGEEWLNASPRSSGRIFDVLMQEGLKSPIDMSSPLIRKECFIQHPFNEELFAEGEAILWRIALTHRFQFLDRPVIILRDHERNAGKALEANWEISDRALTRLLESRQLNAARSAQVRLFRARRARSVAWQGARLGSTRQLVYSALRASAGEPKVLFHPKAPAAFLLASLPRTRENGSTTWELDSVAIPAPRRGSMDIRRKGENPLCHRHAGPGRGRACPARSCDRGDG